MEKRKYHKLVTAFGTLGLGLGIFLGGISTPITAWSTVYNWDGQTGNWTDTAHWSPNGTPTNGDTATIASGTVTSQNSLVLSNATINVNGGALHVNGSDFTIHTNTHVTQTGGEVKMTGSSGRWFNLGESRKANPNISLEDGASTYTMTGGSLDVTDGNFCIGRRGQGHFIMSGADTNVTVGSMLLGYFMEMSSGSTFTLNGGTLTVNGLSRLGGNAGPELSAENLNTEYTFTIDGGTYINKNESYVGFYDGGYNNYNNNHLTSTLYLKSGFWDAKGAVGVAGGDVSNSQNSATGTIDISGGKASFQNSIYIGSGKGSNGTVKITNGEVSFAGNCIVGNGTNSTGAINISGGTTTFKNSPNIGYNDNSTGTINLSGGTTTFENGFSIAPGTNAVGSATISDNANVSVLGWVLVGTGTGATGTLNITGGTTVFEGETRLAGDNVGASGIVNISGGNTTFKKHVYIGRSDNANANTGKMTISGDAVVDFGTTDILCIGEGNNTTGTLEISGGTVTGNRINVGHGRETKGAQLNISSGNSTFKSIAIGNNVNTEGTMTMTGGTFDLSKTNEWSFIGCANGAKATVEIKGGTLYGTKGDFIIGEGNSVAHFIVDGGSYSTKDNKAYNFVIRSTTSNGDIGTLVELKSGELNTEWFSLGQGGTAGGVCTFNMTGGTLNVGNGGEHFRIGHQYDGVANISGGTLNINGPISVSTGSGGNGTLNVIGSGSTWQGKSMSVIAGSTLNFIAGKLGVNADGTAIDAVSTINISDNASVNGAFSINMSDYNYDGVMYVKGDVNQTMINAGSLTWNPNSVTVSDGWILDTTGTSAVLTLDETKIAFADVTSGTAFASGTLGSEGWVKLTGNANDTVSLSMIYGGEGDAEDFVAWLQESLSESQKDVTISSTFDTISFGNLKLDENGLGYLNYDLSAFNLQSGANMSFSNVPEPSTWGLMLVGLSVGFFFRKRKETVKA